MNLAPRVYVLIHVIIKVMMPIFLQTSAICHSLLVTVAVVSVNGQACG